MKINVLPLISVFVYVVLAPFLGALLAGIDRKISARMQGRQGPPILQPLYDVKKLLSKETKVTNTAVTMYLVSFLFFTIITGCMFFAGMDLLLVFFTLTTANIFLIIAASSSNSPYAQMGANREIVQMLAYEPMMLIFAAGAYLVTGSFKVEDIVKSTDFPLIAFLPGIFGGFVFILTIKLRKHPFDLSTSHHAHQEVVKGLTQEFSGELFAIVEISHWYENIFLLGVLSLFFLNANKWTIILTIAGVIICYFIEILVDNTNARVKWKEMFSKTWIVTAVLGALNLILLELIMKGVN